jgi:hypothetical protein
MDPDPQTGLQDPALSGSVAFLLLYLHHRSSQTSHSEVAKQLKTRFLLLFCLLMEGSRSVQRYKQLRIRCLDAQTFTDPTESDPIPEH